MKKVVAVVGSVALVLAITSAAALVRAPGAQAATTYPAINAVLSEGIQRQVEAVCHTPEEWAQLGAAKGFDPGNVLGYVTRWTNDGGRTWWPEPQSRRAPGICERVEAFRLSPTRETQKTCQDGFDQGPAHRVPRSRSACATRRASSTRTRSAG